MQLTGTFVTTVTLGGLPEPGKGDIIPISQMRLLNLRDIESFPLSTGLAGKDQKPGIPTLIYITTKPEEGEWT